MGLVIGLAFMFTSHYQVKIDMELMILEFIWSILLSIVVWHMLLYWLIHIVYLDISVAFFMFILDYKVKIDIDLMIVELIWNVPLIHSLAAFGS